MMKAEISFNQRLWPVIFMIGAGLLLSLFRHWEISGESWGYWLFARIFRESGRVVIFDRGPLYILYLNLFTWMGYPLSVTLEYLVSTLIVVAALIILFRPYLGLCLSGFAAFLWIPFLQVTEPATAKLALALSCLAMAARRLKGARRPIIISYALLGAACMFRSTYIIFILIFGAWDAIRVLKKKRFSGLLSALRPQAGDWPVLLAVFLSVYFLTMQSAHPWNNAYFVTTKWFPDDGKSLVKAGLIQHYNWQYIRDKYKTFEGKDFYFTQKELFGQADTVSGAIMANPGFVAGQLKKNIQSFVPIAVGVTALHNFYLRLGAFARGFKFPVGWLCLFSLLAILYGAFHKVGDDFMFFFSACNVLLVVPCVLILPKERYMLALIPVFILSAYWYGLRLRQAVRGNFFGCLAIPLFLIIFSDGLNGWGSLARNLADDIKKGEVRILEERAFSMRAAYNPLKAKIKNCKGVMSLEHAFIGAFTGIPLSRVYDVWEIPPFGSLGNSAYQGLAVERIDCVLVSSRLATEVGLATNFQIRYENYIKPYIRHLGSIGANVSRVDVYGEAVVLRALQKIRSN